MYYVNTKVPFHVFFNKNEQSSTHCTGMMPNGKQVKFTACHSTKYGFPLVSDGEYIGVVDMFCADTLAEAQHYIGWLRNFWNIKTELDFK
jgi:hypothetical protein